MRCCGVPASHKNVSIMPAHDSDKQVDCDCSEFWKLQARITSTHNSDFSNCADTYCQRPKVPAAAAAVRTCVEAHGLAAGLGVRVDEGVHHAAAAVADGPQAVPLVVQLLRQCLQYHKQSTCGLACNEGNTRRRKNGSPASSMVCV